MQLEQFGWSPFFAEAIENDTRTRACVPGRVARQERGAWEVITESGARLIPHARADVRPVAGDWVALRATLDSIEAVLPRRTALVRRAAGAGHETQVLAANVDVGLIVMGLDGDFNPRRLERYLALVAGSGARPAVLLNKRDLCADLPSRLAEARAAAAGAPVAPLSALYDDVADLFAAMCEPGETAALLGSSGAGKSTLTNRLLGEEAQPTREVRAQDSRGRHTTTNRRLMRMPGGWLLIDMPGLREVGLLEPGRVVDSVFAEIETLAAHCRFRDCGHAGEPGCAVAGTMDAQRLAAWHKLRRESAAMERQSDPLARAEERRMGRRTHKALKAHYLLRGFNKC